MVNSDFFKWLAAHNGRDGSRHARRPAQERAAPTAFQRTSLLMKCNTEAGDCKGLARRTRRMTRMSERRIFPRYSACSAGPLLIHGSGALNPRWAMAGQARITQRSNPRSGGASSIRERCSPIICSVSHESLTDRRKQPFSRKAAKSRRKNSTTDGTDGHG